jgi:antitoxin PrlF
MITSRLTSKSRTTIPRQVRIALGLAEGDEVAYQLDGNRVILRKAPSPMDAPFAVFGEWDSEADRQAYADL